MVAPIPPWSCRRQLSYVSAGSRPAEVSSSSATDLAGSVPRFAKASGRSCCSPATTSALGFSSPRCRSGPPTVSLVVTGVTLAPVTLPVTVISPLAPFLLSLAAETSRSKLLPFPAFPAFPTERPCCVQMILVALVVQFALGLAGSSRTDAIPATLVRSTVTVNSPGKLLPGPT